MNWMHVPPEVNSGGSTARTEDTEAPEPSLPQNVTIIDIDENGRVIRIPTTIDAQERS